ncbi:MAG: hypothetical protein J6M59_08730 [Bacteroidaceae bacterium]|nr:hypothetical protein [Bacteroidaceae bacterium]MBP3245171.1 hypothetical protein [Bacteroidaceae bacterium]
MSKEVIESLLLSEMIEVKGGQASKDCYCDSGAGETVVIQVPIEVPEETV